MSDQEGIAEIPHIEQLDASISEDDQKQLKGVAEAKGPHTRNTQYRDLS